MMLFPRHQTQQQPHKQKRAMPKNAKFDADAMVGTSVPNSKDSGLVVVVVLVVVLVLVVVAVLVVVLVVVVLVVVELVVVELVVVELAVVVVNVELVDVVVVWLVVDVDQVVVLVLVISK